MDQGIGISTHDLLAGIGFIAFYIVYTLILIYQWNHPEHVPYKWFPFHEEPGDRTNPRRVRSLRISSVLSFVFLNGITVWWLIKKFTH